MEPCVATSSRSRVRVSHDTALSARPPMSAAVLLCRPPPITPESLRRVLLPPCQFKRSIFRQPANPCD
jgi:hypothetical protein